MYCTREEYVEWMFHCLIYLKMYFGFDSYLCVYVNIHNVYPNACRSKKESQRVLGAGSTGNGEPCDM